MRITVNIICGLALTLVLCCCKDSRSIEAQEDLSNVFLGVDFGSKSADVVKEDAMNDFRMFVFRSKAPKVFTSMLAQVYGITTNKLLVEVLEGPVMLALISNERSTWRLPRSVPYSTMNIDEVRNLKLDFKDDYSGGLITPPFVMYKESSKTDILRGGDVLNGKFPKMLFSDEADPEKPFQEGGVERTVAKVRISIACQYDRFPAGYKINLTKLSVCNMPRNPFLGRDMTYGGDLFNGNEIGLASPSKYMDYKDTGFSTVGVGDNKNQIELYIPEHIIRDADRKDRYTYLKIEGIVVDEAITFERYLPLGSREGMDKLLLIDGSMGNEGVETLSAKELSVTRNTEYVFTVTFTNLGELPKIEITGATVNPWSLGEDITAPIK